VVETCLPHSAAPWPTVPLCGVGHGGEEWGGNFLVGVIWGQPQRLEARQSPQTPRNGRKRVLAGLMRRAKDRGLREPHGRIFGKSQTVSHAHR
jgi:hypothetical protein